MDWTRKRNAWLLASAVGLAVSGGAFASGSTPTWQDAVEASPNKLTASEQAALEKRAASGESAKQAPEGTYSPSAAGRMSTNGGAVTNPPGSNMESSTDGSASSSTSLNAAPSGNATTTGTTKAPLPPRDDAGPNAGQRRAAPAVPATPATPADPGVNPATPATPATPGTPAAPVDKADSPDDAGARNDVAPRKRELPADRKRG